MEISQRHSLVSSIDTQLGDRAAIDVLQANIEGQNGSFEQLRLHQRAKELEAESVRERVNEVEGKLYGGSITNLRELESFEKEATFLRVQLKEADEGLIENMMAIDEAQQKLRSLEDDRKKAEDQWQARQAELAEERKDLVEALAALESSREGMVSHVGPQELRLYEGLRTSKGGVAIAKVERGLCRGCRMGLPTHQLQRARSGREPVLCNSCGRILFVS